VQRRLRLRQADDFQRVRQRGKAIHHAWLIVSFVPNATSHNRYGFITAKRVGSAVKRNRVRRQLRAIVRGLHLRLRQGYDVVLIAKAAIVGQPFAVLQPTVQQLLEQAGLVLVDC
jgi:ribonuclease P protein component